MLDDSEEPLYLWVATGKRETGTGLDIDSEEAALWGEVGVGAVVLNVGIM